MIFAKVKGKEEIIIKMSIDEANLLLSNLDLRVLSKYKSKYKSSDILWNVFDGIEGAIADGNT